MEADMEKALAGILWHLLRGSESLAAKLTIEKHEVKRLEGECYALQQDLKAEKGKP